jgi:type IV secretory pathway VirJ component
VRRWRLLRAVAALLLALAALPARAEDAGRYGQATLLRPRGAARGFVILFSEGPSWGKPDQTAAARLAGMGAIVLGVNRAAYVAALDKASCHELVGDADGQSKHWQRALGVPAYWSPILAGIGQGGRLAQLALTEAPANTIGGAVSVDPTASPGLTSPPCTRDPAASEHLLGFWNAGLTPAAPADGIAWIDAETKAGRAPARTDFPAGATEADMLAAMVGPHLGQRLFRPEDVKNLPLVELRAAKPTPMLAPMLAIVLSGDGGWRDLDKTIAEKLRADGVNVVGWDSLHYFWSAKTPAQAAADLARVLRVYTTRWHATHVALIGYSFGADVLPFLYNRLPAKERGMVSVISLLGFEKAADFEIRLGGWLGMPPSSSALPEPPELATIPGRLIQCFYGADETDSFCPALGGSGATLVRTPGGHHFGADYGALEQRILSGWHRRDGEGSARAASPDAG